MGSVALVQSDVKSTIGTVKVLKCLHRTIGKIFVHLEEMVG